MIIRVYSIYACGETSFFSAATSIHQSYILLDILATSSIQYAFKILSFEFFHILANIRDYSAQFSGIGKREHVQIHHSKDYTRIHSRLHSLALDVDYIAFDSD